MVHRQATLVHHLFQVTVGELKATVPSDASEDDLAFIVSPLEGIGIMLHV